MIMIIYCVNELQRPHVLPFITLGYSSWSESGFLKFSYWDKNCSNSAWLLTVESLTTSSMLPSHFSRQSDVSSSRPSTQSSSVGEQTLVWVEWDWESCSHRIQFWNSGCCLITDCILASPAGRSKTSYWREHSRRWRAPAACVSCSGSPPCTPWSDTASPRLPTRGNPSSPWSP